MSPCDSIIDGPFVIEKGRHNVTEDWEQEIPTTDTANGYFEESLANSINTVSAN
jgi:penicillin-binding protein 1A